MRELGHGQCGSTTFCNNRERCIEMLTNESPRYLFGTPTNQHCRLNEHLTELNLEAEPRARSDSSSSNMSNASSGSTPLRPPLTSSQGVSYNVPGFRGPITAIEHPSTAPVMRNEINQFMNQLQSHEHHASSGDIPNINCNNSSGSSTSGYSGYRTNYGQHSTNSSACSSPAMLRPIEVQHVQTSGGDNRESPTQAQGPITYRFQINPGGVGSQPGTPSRGWYQPERPTVINFQKPDDSNAGFMKFPPMPSECRVPGHAHGLQKASSVDSESVFVSEMEYNRQPFMSPASSHSSLNSESSSAMRTDRPQSSGSVEEPGYLQALLSHQKSRMEKLKHDLCVAEDRLTIMRGDVTSLERDVIERKRLKSNVFPSSVDLAKLRGDNLQLQAEIQLMTREIDLFNNGQTPLGVLDPIEQQNFYKNMNTGQRGSIYASASTSAPTVTHVSTVTTSIPSRPLPSRPPPEIPPQLPPRDPPRNSDVPPPLPPRLVLVPPVPPAQPAVNSGDSDADGEPWSCSACTFLNYPALTKCEVCEMPRMSSLSPITSPRGEDIPDTYATPVANTPTT
ncbi:TAB3-like protein [Mya arenaria]|uniref:TAB3-like protein n=1 Tax=Mya arenaria TaxID=6604 RepID=A0ABY7EEK2_MYAAR|nr:TAB3-like protein [Mya arenaria]